VFVTQLLPQAQEIGGEGLLEEEIPEGEREEERGESCLSRAEPEDLVEELN